VGFFAYLRRLYERNEMKKLDRLTFMPANTEVQMKERKKSVLKSYDEHSSVNNSKMFA
jgi:hypothetical protein